MVKPNKTASGKIIPKLTPKQENATWCPFCQAMRILRIPLRCTKCMQKREDAIYRLLRKI